MSFTFTPTPQTGTATHFEILRIKTYLSRHNKKKNSEYAVLYNFCYLLHRKLFIRGFRSSKINNFEGKTIWNS